MKFRRTNFTAVDMSESDKNTMYCWSVEGPFGTATEVSWFPDEGVTKEQAKAVADDIARRLNYPWGTVTKDAKDPSDEAR